MNRNSKKIISLLILIFQNWKLQIHLMIICRLLIKANSKKKKMKEEMKKKRKKKKKIKIVRYRKRMN